MDLYNLGSVSWWQSQCYYHALAYLGQEGIIICRPSEPYVCLGLHDDLDQEIDREFCMRTVCRFCGGKPRAVLFIWTAGRSFIRLFCIRTIPVCRAGVPASSQGFSSRPLMFTALSAWMSFLCRPRISRPGVKNVRGMGPVTSGHQLLTWATSS